MPDETRPVILRPPQGVYSRRTFLRFTAGTAAAIGAGGILAACGASATASPSAAPSTAASAAPSAAPSAAASAAASTAASAAASTAPVGGAFNLFTWAGYDGTGVIDDWYKAQGIALNVKYISNENLEAYLKSPGSDQWDASSDNQGDCEYAFSQGISSEITVAEVPSLGTMMPFFRDGTFWKVRDGVYNSVPWTWGPIGINYLKSKVPDGVPSYEALFDAKLKQRIGAYDDALNMVSTAAMATGNDPHFLTRDQLNGPIKAWLVRLKPQLKVLSTSIGDQETLLLGGDVDVELVGLTWFVHDARGKGNTDIQFAVPKEGAFGFVDAVIITPWAKDRQNAIAYANALTSGDTAVAMCESVYQLNTNPAINSKLNAELLGQFPTDLDSYATKTLKFNKFWYDPAGQYATVEEWRKVWDDVKALG